MENISPALTTQAHTTAAPPLHHVDYYRGQELTQYTPSRSSCMYNGEVVPSPTMYTQCGYYGNMWRASTRMPFYQESAFYCPTSSDWLQRAAPYRYPDAVAPVAFSAYPSAYPLQPPVPRAASGHSAPCVTDQQQTSKESDNTGMLREFLKEMASRHVYPTSAKPACGQHIRDTTTPESRDKAVKLAAKIQQTTGFHVCQECFRVCSSESALHSHQIMHLPKSSKGHVVCPICSKTVANRRSLRVHIRSHTGERPYKCSQCHKAFADTSTRAKHEKTHSGLKPYQCTVCSLSFTQKGNLKRHLLNQHRISMPASTQS